MTASSAFEQGRAARRGADPEPSAPYAPGTPQYTDFANGYCADPFPDTQHGATLPRAQKCHSHES